jgi:hypothetical protein
MRREFLKSVKGYYLLLCSVTLIFRAEFGAAIFPVKSATFCRNTGYKITE